MKAIALMLVALATLGLVAACGEASIPDDVGRCRAHGA